MVPLSNNIELVEVHPRYLPECWLVGTVRAMIEDACSHSGGRYEVMDILNLLLQQRMQLWVAVEDVEPLAIALTEIVQFPHVKECRVLCATGNDMKMWSNFIRQIEEWAQDNECRKMLVIARAGWEKVLKPYGYEKNHVQLERDLYVQ